MFVVQEGAFVRKFFKFSKTLIVVDMKKIKARPLCCVACVRLSRSVFFTPSVIVLENHINFQSR